MNTDQTLKALKSISKLLGKRDAMGFALINGKLRETLEEKLMMLLDRLT